MKTVYLVLKFLEKIFLPFEPIPNEPFFLVGIRRCLHFVNVAIIPIFFITWFLAGLVDAFGFFVLFALLYEGFLSQYLEFSKDLIEINQRKTQDEINQEKLEELKNRA